MDKVDLEFEETGTLSRDQCKSLKKALRAIAFVVREESVFPACLDFNLGEIIVECPDGAEVAFSFGVIGNVVHLMSSDGVEHRIKVTTCSTGVIPSR